MSLEAASTSIRAALQHSSTGLIEREHLTQLIVLAAIAQEHVLVIGPPGTAKSEAVRRVAQSLGGRYFEYLLGRFTEPSEVFGPVDLRRLKEGVVEAQTQGMLPEADLAFLDEVFLGSTAILNTLLGLLNERVFRKGHTVVRCPLRVCIGASNALPDEPALAAFADRFLVRTFVEPIGDSQLEALLEGGWQASAWRPTTSASLADVDVLAQAARQVDLSVLRPTLAHAVRLLRKAGIDLSDRRLVKAQRVLAAAAVLAGRREPTQADLWPLVYCVPTADAQRLAKDVLAPLLEQTQSDALGAAAERASNAPLARATRLVDAGTALLAQRPQDDDAQALSSWQLRLEGVMREIDATFERAALPEALAPVRSAIEAALPPA